MFCVFHDSSSHVAQTLKPPRSPSSALSRSFFGEGSPTKIGGRKKIRYQLILTSLLEDLATVPAERPQPGHGSGDLVAGVLGDVRCRSGADRRQSQRPPKPREEHPALSLRGWDMMVYGRIIVETRMCVGIYRESNWESKHSMDASPSHHHKLKPECASWQFTGES